jgi:hypothetical protein
MNSGGSGRTWLCPGATKLAPRKAWKYSIPPSARRRVEQCGQWILREQKCSLPSSAMSTRPPRRWNGPSAVAARVAKPRQNSPSKAAGATPSSINRM